MENQESMWYAPSGDTPQASPPVLVPPAKPKKKMPAWGIALILVAVAVLIIGSCLLFRNSAAADPNRPGAAGDLPNDYKSFFDNYFTANEEAEECTIPTVQTTERVTVKLSPAGKTPLSAQEVYERCVPSIVAVSAFPDETSEDSYYWGSGVVLTEDGYILTNSHVVEGTCRARITLWDDTEYDALLVGYDHRTDIAVLKIDAHGLTPAEFTSTDSLLVGDAVYAIGNPLGKEFRSTMTEDGYILTNSHVVEGTCRARITLWDDTEYDALLVGYDHRTDIAVLKIDAHGLTPAEFTSTDSLLVGDAVYAIGNPLGKEFRSTMTEGIISGINRDISHNGVTNSLLQTSAPINEGNSGGALVNVYGQVVGVTNMKMSSQYIGSVSIEGVAFAIPSSTVKTIADSLLESGEVRGRPALGLTVGKIPQAAMEEYDLPAGLYVSAVSEGSDCAAKGIVTGDVLLAANGVELTVNEDLTGIIAPLRVGDELTLTVWHEGETRDITVKLVDVNDVY